MLKKLILIAGLLGLGACTSIMAPVPKAASDWAFAKDKVTLSVLDENMQPPTDGEETIVIEITKNSPANDYMVNYSGKISRGKVWFKKSPTTPDTYAFAIGAPFDEKDALTPDEAEEMRTTAIYSRGKFVKIGERLIFNSFVLECPNGRKDSKSDCPYKSDDEAWQAALTLPTSDHSEDSKDVLSFEIK